MTAAIAQDRVFLKEGRKRGGPSTGLVGLEKEVRFGGGIRRIR